MIYAVTSNHRSFKAVEFTPGMNLILADRTQESTRLDSRNGLGKTTLFEIIHFCLGARATDGKGLLVDPLSGWTFTVTLDLGGMPVKVTRSVDHPSRVLIEGATNGWPIQPVFDRDLEYPVLGIGQWTSVLGMLMFGLIPDTDPQEYTPSFRSLISYIVRRGKDAFSNPFEHYRKQLEWDKQVNNAFLLGLTWEDASDLQKLKDKRRLLDNLRAAAQAGMMTGMIGSLGELEAQEVQLQTIVHDQRERLGSFRVHPEYRNIEKEANELTEKIHEAANQNVADSQLLDLYATSVHSEHDPETEELVSLYEQASVQLPGAVQRRLNDVQDFHRRLLLNRERFLSDEIHRLRMAIMGREDVIQTSSHRRAELLQILRTHRALDEYTQMQSDTSKLWHNSKISRHAFGT